ncbi:apolipoprotein N-acyltransferase [Amycolatopsis mediterranei S699]|uniref:Apolipoprotein N-acyltransferase n=2 Tax=Amycolatopsis mediterranei TaxID=33910 RepID=A0A0H3D0Q6_AMYMU|nr:apolipoprotein N-acyltransferase [Amycolatopsis mediterranei]ADJ43086.1 apolipoprotein N-acyltransferase [Amycolatopsis mediterranei U32]AEK39783.1 apolipoprotein N-acyltransferase [Amycolatopsis mediterranei S699]AFO74800.1 apolipoprotein N-acyltransferase [Amycolatopsis mediterranei S699]AGT81929.1 apolipoprotein N-acyltransferase [Amycolatopsis mediterranei RB]KDO04996.1 acyltransferase [Amycolatopsis mediterranei]
MNKLGWALVATVASAVLFFFGTGLDPVPELAWLAPLPVLLLAPRVPGAAAMACAFVAYLAGSAGSWSYFWHSLSIPRPAAIGILGGSALLFALSAGLFRVLVRRGHGLPAALAAPALWTVVLYVVSLLNPTGVMDTLMTTQADRPSVLRLATVTGGWGVEFLVLFVPAAVAAALAPGVRARARLSGLVVTAAVLAGLVFWTTPPLTGPPTRIALLAMGQSRWALDVATFEGRTRIQSYVDEIGRLPEGVQAVVLPEATFAVDEASRPRLVEAFTQVARAKNLDVVTGVIDTTPDGRFNAALAIPPSGPPVEYRKWHNGDSPNLGSGTRTAHLAGIGLMVCMDVNFADPSGEYGEAGTGLVLIPASDEDVDGWAHSRTALIRGVENGFSVAWSAARGTPMLADARGHVLAETHTGDRPFSVVVADVPLGPGKTPYARFGDWFAWLCGLVALAGIGTAARRPSLSPVTTNAGQL